MQRFNSVLLNLRDTVSHSIRNKSYNGWIESRLRNYPDKIAALLNLNIPLHSGSLPANLSSHFAKKFKEGFYPAKKTFRTHILPVNLQRNVSFDVRYGGQAKTLQFRF